MTQARHLAACILGRGETRLWGLDSRERIARQYRAEGEEEARRIRAEADREARVVVAEATSPRRTRGRGTRGCRTRAWTQRRRLRRRW